MKLLSQFKFADVDSEENAKKAIRVAVCGSESPICFIVTGGPAVGKTTFVKECLMPKVGNVLRSYVGFPSPQDFSRGLTETLDRGYLWIEDVFLRPQWGKRNPQCPVMPDLCRFLTSKEVSYRKFRSNSVQIHAQNRCVVFITTGIDLRAFFPDLARRSHFITLVP